MRVVEGGKRLAKTRHHLDAADLTLSRVASTSGTAPATGSRPTAPVMSRSATSPSPSPPTAQVSLRLPKPLEHLANATRMAATCCPARRCSPTAPTSGWPGSPADSRCPTPSPARPAGPVATSPPPGPAQPETVEHQRSTVDTEVRARGPGGRGGSQRRAPRACDASTRTATRSAQPRTHRHRPRRRRPRAATPRSATPSPGSSTTPRRHGIDTHRRGGSRLRRRPHHRARNNGPRASAVNASARR